MPGQLSVEYHGAVKRICVFCGSTTGGRDSYKVATLQMGRALVRRGLGLVYGGGRIGLMGTLADQVLALGGEATGVIPRALAEKGVAHQGLTALHVVESMHERKARLVELADGFVALPGGFGTLDELCETLSLGQLRLHAKPCGLLNVDGYFDQLLAFLDHVSGQGFLQSEHRDMLLVSANPDELLDHFTIYRPHDVEKLTGLDG